MLKNISTINGNEFEFMRWEANSKEILEKSKTLKWLWIGVKDSNTLKYLHGVYRFPLG